MAAREIDAGTNGQPVGQVGRDVGSSIIAFAHSGIPLHVVLLVVVAEGQVVGGAVAGATHRHIVAL